MDVTYDQTTGEAHYNAGPGGHVVILNQVNAGVVTLPDGIQVDTAPAAVEVPSQLHGAQLLVHLAGNDAAAVTQEHLDAQQRVGRDDGSHDYGDVSLVEELSGLLTPTTVDGE